MLHRKRTESEDGRVAEVRKQAHADAGAKEERRVRHTSALGQDAHWMSTKSGLNLCCNFHLNFGTYSHISSAGQLRRNEV